MEKLLTIDQSLQKITIKSFLDEELSIKRKLPIAIDEVKDTSSIEKAMNVPAKIFKEIQKKCGPHIFDSYACEISENIIPDDTVLASLEHQKKVLKKRKSLPTRPTEIRYIKPLKDYKLLQHFNSLKFTREKAIEHPEVLLTVTFYHPHQIYSSNAHVYASQMTNNVDQMFYVMGHSTLISLKDKIYCNNDFGLCEDISENPRKPINYFTKDIFKSGCFLIEKSFYNDMRHTSNVDYSDIIKKWAQDPSRGLGPFLSLKMEKTKFLDLEISLGKPYMYLHQGDCQHLFVFSDLRLVARDDPQNAGLYPIRTYIVRDKPKYCYVCSLNPVSYITYNDSHVPDDPSLFCTECFMFLHYDDEEKKKGSFLAYPYFDRNRICSKKIPSLCTI